MMSPIGDMTSLSDFFDVSVFFLSSLVTDPSFTSISWLVLELWQFLFVKNWSEVRKSLPNIWKAEQLRDTKFGTNFPNKTLLNATKCQSYSSYCFWVIKKKTTVKWPPTPNQIRVKWKQTAFKQLWKHSFCKKALLIYFLQNFDWWCHDNSKILN